MRPDDINNHDNVDGAVRPGERQVAAKFRANPQIEPTNLSCEAVSRLLPPTSTITIYYYYSARNLIHILPYHGV